jgi:hypothetical protein
MENNQQEVSDFVFKNGQNLYVKINWNWLCGKCQKRFMKNLVPIAKRYMKNHPDMSMRAVAKFYGVPHSTFHDAIKGKYGIK